MIGVYSVVESSNFDTSGTFQTIFSSQAALVFLSMAFLCTVIVGRVRRPLGGLDPRAVRHASARPDACCTAVNVALASVIAVAIGVAPGAVNGFLVVYVGVNTIVVTLGMSTLLSGIALAISHLSAVSGLSASFGKLALANVGGGSAGLLLLRNRAHAAFAYVLAFTPLGRHMQFVGANREVSRLAGVRVNAIRFGAFVVAGRCCAGSAASWSSAAGRRL